MLYKDCSSRMNPEPPARARDLAQSGRPVSAAGRHEFVRGPLVLKATWYVSWSETCSAAKDKVVPSARQPCVLPRSPFQMLLFPRTRPAFLRAVSPPGAVCRLHMCAVIVRTSGLTAGRAGGLRQAWAGRRPLREVAPFVCSYTLA